MKRNFAEAPSLVFQKECCAYAIRPLRQKRNFAEAPSLVFQKECCAYAIRPLRQHSSPPRAYVRVFPPRCNAVYGHYLRSSHRISLPRCRTERFKTGFFPAMAFLQQWYIFIELVYIYIYFYVFYYYFFLSIIFFVNINLPTCSIFLNFLKFFWECN